MSEYGKIKYPKVHIEPHISPGYGLNENLTELGYDLLLDEAKNKIDLIDPKEWSIIRKNTNKYEFPVNPRIRKPVSRAFYKLWEMLMDFNLNINTESFHIAEAPGGFIEATLYYKEKKYNFIKKCHTISLYDSNYDIPTYHQLIKGNINVSFYKGKDNTGDICKLNNLISFVQELKDTQITFITADGGITENGCFNQKEQIHYKLIFSEVIAALFVLKEKGHFILKLFDLYTKFTMNILHLLSYLFDEVFITKPKTSRPTNSEKYAVCKGYHQNLLTSTLRNKLFHIAALLQKTDLQSFMTDFPVHERDAITKINNMYSGKQIKHIEYNLSQIGQITISHQKKKLEKNFFEWNAHYKAL